MADDTTMSEDGVFGSLLLKTQRLELKNLTSLLSSPAGAGYTSRSTRETPAVTPSSPSYGRSAARSPSRLNRNRSPSNHLRKQVSFSSRIVSDPIDSQDHLFSSFAQDARAPTSPMKAHQLKLMAQRELQSWEEEARFAQSFSPPKKDGVQTQIEPLSSLSASLSRSHQNDSFASRQFVSSYPPPPALDTISTSRFVPTTSISPIRSRPLSMRSPLDFNTPMSLHRPLSPRRSVAHSPGYSGPSTPPSLLTSTSTKPKSKGASPERPPFSRASSVSPIRNRSLPFVDRSKMDLPSAMSLELERWNAHKELASAISSATGRLEECCMVPQLDTDLESMAGTHTNMDLSLTFGAQTTFMPHTPTSLNRVQMDFSAVETEVAAQEEVYSVETPSSRKKLSSFPSTRESKIKRQREQEMRACKETLFPVGQQSVGSRSFPCASMAVMQQPQHTRDASRTVSTVGSVSDFPYSNYSTDRLDDAQSDMIHRNPTQADSVHSFDLMDYDDATAVDSQPFRRLLLVTGKNNFGQLGLNHTRHESTFVRSSLSVNASTAPDSLQVTSSIVGVSFGSEHACAVDERGMCYSWGIGLDGQLGLGKEIDFIHLPVQLSAMQFARTVNMNSTSLPSDSGVLDGTSHNISSAGSTVIEDVSRRHHVVEVVCGDSYTLARSETGDVYLWGLMGRDNHYRYFYPSRVPDLKHIVQVAAGKAHTLALDCDGQVYSWGDNEAGQLGLESTTTKFIKTPRALASFIHPVKQVAAGSTHSAALTTHCNLYIWGNGANGRLGLGDRKTTSTPTMVTLQPDPKEPTQQENRFMNEIVHIALGGNFSVAVTVDGDCYSWGGNQYGQLGLTDEKERWTPSRITRGLDRGVEILACGQYHVIALLKGGQIVSWGCNEFGQLGHNDQTSKPYPSVPPVLRAFANLQVLQITAGAAQSAILLDADSEMEGALLSAIAPVVKANERVVNSTLAASSANRAAVSPMILDEYNKKKAAVFLERRVLTENRSADSIPDSIDPRIQSRLDTLRSSLTFSSAGAPESQLRSSPTFERRRQKERDQMQSSSVMLEYSLSQGETILNQPRPDSISDPAFANAVAASTAGDGFLSSSGSFTFRNLMNRVFSSNVNPDESTTEDRTAANGSLLAPLMFWNGKTDVTEDVEHETVLEEFESKDRREQGNEVPLSKSSASLLNDESLESRVNVDPGSQIGSAEKISPRRRSFSDVSKRHIEENTSRIRELLRSATPPLLERIKAGETWRAPSPEDVSLDPIEQREVDTIEEMVAEENKRRSQNASRNSSPKLNAQQPHVQSTFKLVEPIQPRHSSPLVKKLDLDRAVLERESSAERDFIASLHVSPADGPSQPRAQTPSGTQEGVPAGSGSPPFKSIDFRKESESEAEIRLITEAAARSLAETTLDSDDEQLLNLNSPQSIQHEQVDFDGLLPPVKPIGSVSPSVSRELVVELVDDSIHYDEDFDMNETPVEY